MERRVGNQAMRHVLEGFYASPDIILMVVPNLAALRLAGVIAGTVGVFECPGAWKWWVWGIPYVGPGTYV